MHGVRLRLTIIRIVWEHGIDGNSSIVWGLGFRENREGNGHDNSKETRAGMIS